MPHYNQIQVEHLCRIAAARGFVRGVDWLRKNPHPYAFPSEKDLADCDNAIIGELRAEGKIPHWE